MASFWYASSVNKQPPHRDTQSEHTLHMEPEPCPATPRQHPPTGPAWGACCFCWSGGKAKAGSWLQRSFIIRRYSCGEQVGLAAVSRGKESYCKPSLWRTLKFPPGIREPPHHQSPQSDDLSSFALSQPLQQETRYQSHHSTHTLYPTSQEAQQLPKATQNFQVATWWTTFLSELLIENFWRWRGNVSACHVVMNRNYTVGTALSLCFSSILAIYLKTCR